MSGYDPTTDDSQNPYSPSYLAMKIAEVIEVNFEEMSVMLRIKNAQESDRTPTVLSFPCVGNRMFLGGMPQIGDFAIVGWTMISGNKTPVIISWIGAGLAFARDWLTSQPFQQEEYDMNDEQSQYFKGAYNRIRHKLRSLNSGDILASSASGSDILLDEGVLITNRRGNEIHLRDADQSIVTQSLNLFNVQSGVRSYSGAIQRDFFNLPTQMFSDGSDFSSYELLDEDGRPLTSSPSELDLGELSPHPVFAIDQNGNLERTLFPERLNPFKFLQEVGIINEEYLQVYPFEDDPAVYGGKYFYRVEDRIGEKLTEHRVELTHTSDGTLPMSEQTEGGVDIGRTPPFIEQVMGTVISNDSDNIELYGKPLVASILPTPTLIDGSKKDASEHLAYLTKITPPIEKPEIERTPFLFGVAKNGRAFLNVTGRRDGDKDFAAVARFGSGIQLNLGKNTQRISFFSESSGAFVVKASGEASKNAGISLTSVASGIELVGEGFINEPSQFEDEGNKPLSVKILGSQSVGITAGDSILLSAPNGVIFSELEKFEVAPKDTYEVRTSEINNTSTTVNHTVQGQELGSFSGPKDGRPSNYPIRECNLTTTIPSPNANICETNIFSGMQTRTIKTNGSFRQRIRGNGKITNTVSTGKVQNIVGAAKTVLNNSNFNMTLPKTMKVLAGASIKQTATGKITLKAGGIAKLQGSTVVLKGIGGTRGGIICDGTINPLTGLSFKASGIIGSLAHRLK